MDIFSLDHPASALLVRIVTPHGVPVTGFCGEFPLLVHRAALKCILSSLMDLTQFSLGLSAHWYFQRNEYWLGEFMALHLRYISILYLFLKSTQNHTYRSVLNTVFWFTETGWMPPLYCQMTICITLEEIQNQCANYSVEWLTDVVRVDS